MLKTDYIKKILAKAQEADVISFDVFDTLLIRPYARPTDLFFHLEQLEKMPGFAACRIATEQKLHSQKSSGVEEICFDDIYAAMGPRYASMRAKELAMEAQVLFADPEMLELVTKLAKNNKKIIAISDMYLPGAVIADILKAKGYDVIKKVYCSSDFLISKWSGNLFKCVSADLNVSPSKILHIGDNEHSDFKMAKSAGYNAFLWPQKKEIFLDMPENLRLKTLCANNCEKLAISITVGLAIRDWVLNGVNDDYWKRIGYIFGGALCYGYSRFIIDEILRQNIDGVLFVARDGWILNKICDIIGGPQWNKMPRYYVYAQRIFNLAMSLAQGDSIPSQLNSILTFFGNRISQLQRELPKTGIIPRNIGLALFEKYKLEIRLQAAKFHDEYKRYLDSFGLTGKNIALVDFSAANFNSAFLLQRMFPNKHLHGIYCLCAPTTEPKISYTEYKKTEAKQRWFKEYNILEFFVTSPEHPVIDLQNGVPVYSDKESAKCAAYVHMSDGEMQFARDMLTTFGTNQTRFEYSAIVDIIDAFSECATKQDVAEFDKITFSADEMGRDIIKFNIKVSSKDFSLTAKEKQCAGLVSIIMPVYNCKQYLARSVGSLLAQTYKNIEVICVNDGSKDDSLEELNRIAAQDSRVRVISQKNSGPAAARNAGLDVVHGKWLVFCDSDDWYESDAIEQMLSAMLRNNVDIVSADNCVVWGTGQKFEARVGATEWQKLKTIGMWHLNKLENVIQLMGSVLWGRMFRIDKIRQYNIRFPKGYEHDDTCFMAQCYAVMDNMFCLNQVVYNYVVRNNSIMDLVYKKKNNGRELDTYYSTQKLFEFLYKNDLFNENNNKNFLWAIVGSLTFALSYIDNIDKQIKTMDLYRNLLHSFGFDKLERYHLQYFYPILSALARGNYSFVLKNLNIASNRWGKYMLAIRKEQGRTKWLMFGISILTKNYEETGIKWRLFDAITVKKRGPLQSNLSFNAASLSKKSNIKPLHPIFDNAVSIFFAINNKFAPVCGVTIQSIKANANPNRHYDIVVSVSDVSPENRERLQSMMTQNVSIRLIDANEFLSGVDSSIFVPVAHFSKDAYFRFFIPKIFANYTKVLYLDADIIVRHDVAALFDIDIGNNWWGVTHEKLIHTQACVKNTWAYNTFVPYVKNILQMNKVDDYFNSGVMIWNVRQCIQDNITEKCLAKLAKLVCPRFVDQDVMNSLANGQHIYFLEDKWNVEWNAPFQWTEATGSAGYEECMELLKDPYILHYTDVKPWNEPYRQNAHYFWEIARQSPFYEILLFDFISQSKEEKRTNYNSLAFIKAYWTYLRCRIWSNFTWGEKRQHYLYKKHVFHNEVRRIRKLLK